MSIFSTIGKGVSNGVKAVKNAGESVISTGVKAVTHPLDTVKAIPGVALNAALWLPHAAAQGGGRVVELTGKVTGSERLENVGQGIQDASAAVVKGGIANPVASTQILLGSVMTATGVGSAAGLALAGKGTSGVLMSAVTEAATPPGVYDIRRDPRYVLTAVAETVRPPNPNNAPAAPLFGLGQVLRPPNQLPAPMSAAGGPVAPAAPVTDDGETFFQWLTRVVRELFT